MTYYLKPRFALPCIAGVLILGLLSGVGTHMHALSSGKEISIAAQGYDPRDILLGHYVQLRADLEFALTPENAEEVRSDFDFERSTNDLKGWIVLRNDESGWQPVSFHAEKPVLADKSNTVAIRTNAYAEEVHASDNDATVTLKIVPQLDIDRFYANQSEALAIEERLRASDADVRMILSVNASGEPLLKGVSVDGNRQVISWW